MSPKIQELRPEDEPAVLVAVADGVAEQERMAAELSLPPDNGLVDHGEVPGSALCAKAKADLDGAGDVATAVQLPDADAVLAESAARRGRSARPTCRPAARFSRT